MTDDHGAFAHCSNLATITFEEGSRLKIFSERMFQACDSLTDIKIPANVEKIGTGAFSFCPGLTSITIPANVKSIGSYAFGRCKNLTSVTFASGSAISGRDFKFSAFTNRIIKSSGENLKKAYLKFGSGTYFLESLFSNNETEE